MLSGALARREPCTACGQPVFLAQRLLVDHRLYHRTCFRCARCGAQLTFSGCYQTETDGQYCCETCPDEEMNTFGVENSLYADMETKLPLVDQTYEKESEKILCDEEKSNLKTSDNIDRKSNITNDDIPKWESSIAFSGFLSNLHKKDSDDEDVLPALPTSLPPDKSSIFFKEKENNVSTIDSKTLNDSNQSNKRSSVVSENKLSLTETVSSDNSDNDKLLISDISVNVCENDISALDEEESILISKKIICEQIHSVDVENNVNTDFNQLETASCPKDNENKSTMHIDTEEIEDNVIERAENNITDNVNETKEILNESKLSLVKSRMKIFEGIEETNTNSVQERNFRIPKNGLYDENIISDNMKSDFVSNENSQFVNTLDINSVSETEILEDSTEIKFDINEDVSYSNNASHVPLQNSENAQNVNLSNDINRDLIPNMIINNNICNSDTLSINISENNESILKNVYEKDKEDMKIPENVDIISQEISSVNDEKVYVIQNEILNDPNNIHSKNGSDMLITDKCLKEDFTIGKMNEEKKSDAYPGHLNPFSDNDDDDHDEKIVFYPRKSNDSKNPFECSSDEKEEDEILEKTNVPVKKKSNEKPPRPPPPTFLLNSNRRESARRVIAAPPSTNPFSSDEDENSEDESTPVRIPVPTPRQSIKDMQDTSSSSMSFLSIEPRSFYGSSTSLTSTISRRKKSQAPKPPAVTETFYSTPKKDDLSENMYTPKNTLATSHFSSRDNGSISPRSRKRRPAPLPPTISVQSSLNISESSSYDQNLNSFDQQLKTNVFCSTPILQDENLDVSLISPKRVVSAAEFDNDPDFAVNDVWENESSEKDVKEKELNFVKEEEIVSKLHDKSVSGQWKRRKGPAPAIPLLQRRNPGPPMPPAVLRRELQMLEAQQRGLEKQGVRLEELIRDRCENNTPPDGNVSVEPDPETDELVLQLFELVNEKNELFRRQSELMYIRRQQRLEEEHADLEHQIRILMARPEANKTDTDKAKEEQLIQRLVEVVERRNEVIASLEMDRLREQEEDKTIRERMASHRAKREENSSLSSIETSNKDIIISEKKKNKRQWIKKVKSKKIDTNKILSEEQSEQTLQKEKKNKKWF